MKKTLPLPAQIFRAGAEAVMEKSDGFSYSLLSLWPINAQNKAKTDVETQGLNILQIIQVKIFMVRKHWGLQHTLPPFILT